MDKIEISKELMREALRLRREAESLERAAKILTGEIVEHNKKHIHENQMIIPNNNSTMQERGETRLQQLSNFIRDNGPATRREILLKTGLPKGTVSHLLGTMKDVFEIKEGQWHIKNKE